MADKETNSPKDTWKDPSGNVVKVDPSKWSADDLAARVKAGWSKAEAAKPAKAEK